MGFLRKLMPWKHDEFDFDSALTKEMGTPDELGGMPVQDNLGLGEKSPFGDQSVTTGTNPFASAPSFDAPLQQPRYAPSQQPFPTAGNNRDLELLSSKLDTVKALLSSLDQRLANVERAVGVQQKQERLW